MKLCKEIKKLNELNERFKQLREQELKRLDAQDLSQDPEKLEIANRLRARLNTDPVAKAYRRRPREIYLFLGLSIFYLSIFCSCYLLYGDYDFDAHSQIANASIVKKYTFFRTRSSTDHIVFRYAIGNRTYVVDEKDDQGDFSSYSVGDIIPINYRTDNPAIARLRDAGPSKKIFGFITRDSVVGIAALFFGNFMYWLIIRNTFNILRVV